MSSTPLRMFDHSTIVTAYGIFHRRFKNSSFRDYIVVTTEPTTLPRGIFFKRED
jgi:hypothetical protein